VNLKRRSRAAWEGSVGEGSGTISLGSGTFEGTYSANARVARETDTTNPEELVAAAHAGCFTMSLANELTEAGHPAGSLDTTATVYLEKREDGYTIPRIELETAGKVEGMGQARFEELARQAARNCTISRLLAAADISVKATLERG
jgi:osmotically inducible protein OsmC